MLLSMRKNFISVTLTLLALFLSVLACNLPDGLVEQAGEGLASLELFVATTGNDASDCQTLETACRTLHHTVIVANEMVSATIQISPGTYDEVDPSIISKSMVLRGSEGVIINLLPDTSPDIDSLFIVLPPDTGTVRMENLIIQGGDIGIRAGSGRLELSRVNLRNIAKSAIDAFDVDAKISVENSEISNIGFNPINLGGGGVQINIVDTVIHDNNNTPIINRGSTINLDRVRIFNNRSTGEYPSAILNAGDGTGGVDGGHISISNSAIYGNIQDGDGSESADDAIRNSQGLLEIFNSTVSGNSGTGVSSGGLGTETVLTHVTVANHPLSGVSAPENDSRVRVKLVNSLIVYNGRDCDLRTINSDSSPERARSENNIDSDNTCRETQSVERAAWDFSPGVDGVLGADGTHALLPGSAAIDAVDCMSGIVSDQRGVARPQGLRCDVGAYERTPTLGDPPIGPSMTPYAVIQGTTMPQPTLPILQTQIASATPMSNPFVRFTTGANCRSGPGTIYSVITALPEGTEAPAEGRNNENTWWWIFAGGNTRCWVSSITLETFGPVTGLPVIPAPPTPAPTFTPQAPVATETKALQLPSAPGQLFIENRVCNGQSYAVSLSWLDLANNEQGYRVYRDGALISTLGTDLTKYTDTPPYGGPYTYGVESFNVAGVSTLMVVAESGCIP
jgi:hypothetical protein